MGLLQVGKCCGPLRSLSAGISSSSVVNVSVTCFYCTLLWFYVNIRINFHHTQHFVSASIACFMPIRKLQFRVLHSRGRNTIIVKEGNIIHILTYGVHILCHDVWDRIWKAQS
jgi:hypothetical protein